MSITAANSIITLGVASIFPLAQRLQGFASDEIFSADALETVEVLSGVDGKMSAGYVYVPTKTTFSLQADSNSNLLFDEWFTQQRIANDNFFAFGLIVLPSIGTSWVLTKGALTSYSPIPDAGKLLKMRKYQVTWESMLPAPG